MGAIVTPVIHLVNTCVIVFSGKFVTSSRTIQRRLVMGVDTVGHARDNGGMEALDKAISLVGGVGKLASAIGIGQPAISNWKARGTPIDPILCVGIEKATGGQVTRRDLRPNDWWRIWPELEEAE